MPSLFSLRELRRRARVLLGRGDDHVLSSLCSTPADAEALEEAMRLPDRAWRRMDRLDRARARASLARILASVGERARIEADVTLWAGAFLEAWRAHAAHVPVLFAPGPIGGRPTFSIARVDLDRLAAAAPRVLEDLLAALDAWAAAAPTVRLELAHELVVCAVSVAEDAAARRRPADADAGRVHALRVALEGKTPAAATDAEVAIALCRAYVRGILRAGEDTPFDGAAEGARDHV